MSTDIGNRIRSSLNMRRNMTDGLLAFVTDEDRQSEKYLSAIKEKVPSVFREFFGRYSEASAADLAAGGEDLLLDSSLVSQSTPTDNYYSFGGLIASTSMSPTTTTTTSFLPSLAAGSNTHSSSNSFGDLVKNRTLTGLHQLKSNYKQREVLFIEVVSVLENLPLYFTLSYLLMRYGLLFFDSLAELCLRRRKNSGANSSSSSYSSAVIGKNNSRAKDEELGEDSGNNYNDGAGIYLILINVFLLNTSSRKNVP